MEAVEGVEERPQELHWWAIVQQGQKRLVMGWLKTGLNRYQRVVTAEVWAQDTKEIGDALHDVFELHAPHPFWRKHLRERGVVYDSMNPLRAEQFATVPYEVAVEWRRPVAS